MYMRFLAVFPRFLNHLVAMGTACPLSGSNRWKSTPEAPVTSREEGEATREAEDGGGCC